MSGDGLPAPEQVEPGVVVHRDVFVRTRDGVGLATDIYRPARTASLDRPAPVILERTPYGKSNKSRSEIEVGMAEPMTRAAVAAHFVRHGYVVIFQDCRGRHGSEGEFVKYLSEGRRRLRHDGVDHRSSPGATAASARWDCPTPRIRRWQRRASIRRGSRR